MSGFGSKYCKNEREFARFAARKKRPISLDEEESDTKLDHPSTIIVIKGEYEGMVANLDGQRVERQINGTDPIGTREMKKVWIKVTVINYMAYTFNRCEWSEGDRVWVDMEDIDLYDKVVKDECLAGMEWKGSTSYLARVTAELLRLYSFPVVDAFRQSCYNSFRHDLHKGKSREEYMVEKLQDMLDAYRLDEMRDGTPAWFWRKANELVEWKSDCLHPHRREDNTVCNMDSAFKAAVREAIKEKQRWEEEGNKRRDASELRRIAIQASMLFYDAVKKIQEFEEHTSVRLVIPTFPDGSEAAGDSLFERALPHSTRTTLENLIGGLQQVADADPSTMRSALAAGKEAFSFTECQGCGDDIGSGQCMRCLCAPECTWMPETPEDVEERRKRPRH
jgi:hypothetical protein